MTMTSNLSAGPAETCADQTEINKSTVIAFADCYSRHDWDGIRALCTEDFRWVVPIAEEVQSAQLRAAPAVMLASDRSLDEMLEIFKYVITTAVDEVFTAKIGVITAEADRVAAEAESYAVSKATNRVYRNKYIWLMYFRSGKICLFREYQDTLHCYDVWMAP
jgi:ketosteroid isomerase-like protein